MFGQDDKQGAYQKDANTSEARDGIEQRLADEQALSARDARDS